MQIDCDRKYLSQPFAHNKEKGMTLLEIIIVVALLGTLMAILVNNLTSSQDNAKEDQARIAMGNISQQLQMYKIYANRYPTTAQGLNALVENPGDGKKWRGPYIEKNKLEDPWGVPFNYESDGRKYKIISAGIDEEFGTEDDVTYPEEDK